MELNYLLGNLQMTKMARIVDSEDDASALQRDIDIMVMLFQMWEMLFNVDNVKSLITVITGQGTLKIEKTLSHFTTLLTAPLMNAL